MSLEGEILIVTGPPGAGKSTMARALVEKFALAVLLQGDWYFDRVIRGGIEPWKPLSHHQNAVVTRAMAASAREYALGGYAVVLEGIIGPWFLDTFVPVAGEVPVHYVVIRPSADTAMARAVAREAPALVDPEAIEKMYPRVRTARRPRAPCRRHQRALGRGDGHRGAGSSRRTKPAPLARFLHCSHTRLREPLHSAPILCAMEDKPRTTRKRRPHPARRARRITAAASAAAFVAMGAGMAHSAAQPQSDDETSVTAATSSAATTSTWAATPVTATAATSATTSTSTTVATTTTVAAHTQTQGS